jgi:single-strand selective monofunctional uracil DNA glycosylase
MSRTKTAQQMIDAARDLRDAVHGLQFSKPVTHVYNPLDYAWDVHQQYLERFASGRRRIVLLGMNPGPWGMAQTGVPFGEIDAVRDWMKLNGRIGKPAREHPKREICGFDCHRSEVSGRRLWGSFADWFGSADAFFKDRFVANYCPLVFMQESGRNHTPDKLPAAEREALFAACDEHLRRVVDALQAEWVLGIGKFAAGRAEEALGDDGVRLGYILHPSPQNPKANRDWAGEVRRQLRELGVSLEST